MNIWNIGSRVGASPIKNNEDEIKPPSKSTFNKLPIELIDTILEHIAKPYIPIESTQQLFSCMRINKLFLDRVKKILKDKKIFSAWNRDKEFINGFKELHGSSYIKYTNKARQTKWCKNKLNAMRKDDSLHQNQMVYGFKRVIEKVRHIELSLLYIKHAGRNAIFDSLLKRSNIKSLNLYIGYEDNLPKKRYVETIAKILNKNQKLVDISSLSFDKNTLNIEDIDPLMQALLNKKVHRLHFNGVIINKETVKIFAKHLKKLDINFLSIDSAGLGNEGAKYLVENLPKNLKTLSLNNNNIDATATKYIFNKLKDTKIEYIYFSNNNLSGFQANDFKKIASFSSIREVHLMYCGLFDSKPDFTEIKNKNKNTIYIAFENRRMER